MNGCNLNENGIDGWEIFKNTKHVLFYKSTMYPPYNPPPFQTDLCHFAICYWLFIFISNSFNSHNRYSWLYTLFLTPSSTIGCCGNINEFFSSFLSAIDIKNIYYYFILFWWNLNVLICYRHYCTIFVAIFVIGHPFHVYIPCYIGFFNHNYL